MPQNKLKTTPMPDAKVVRQTKAATQSNALAFCVDDAFLPFALFAATQILQKEPNIAFDVCLCVIDIDQVPAYFLEQPGLRFVQIEITGIGHLPTTHLSLATYHRLFLPPVFAADYRYIVYLDADIYINRPFSTHIATLIDRLPPQFCVAAAPDITEISCRSRKSNGVTPMIAAYLKTYHQHHHIYRNAGILVFHVPNYLRQNILSRTFTVMANNLQALRCHDQSALNLSLASQMPVLPFEMNWQMHNLTYRLVSKRRPYILHFIGANKPWVSSNPFVSVYYPEYADFFRRFFPDRVLPRPKSVYRLRLEKPKHSHKIKEFFSSRLAKLGTPLNQMSQAIKFHIYRNKRIESAIDELNTGHADAPNAYSQNGSTT